MTPIENLAHILGKLVKDYEKVMRKGRAHYLIEENAKRYLELRSVQESQIRELQESTPCQS